MKLISRSSLADDLIFGVLLVPQLDQFIGGLANVLAVADGAGEHAGDVQPFDQRRIGAVHDAERAVEGDIGRPRAETFDLDRASGAQEIDQLVAHFLDALVERGFHQPGCPGGIADKFRLLNCVTLVDARAVGSDCFYS